MCSSLQCCKVTKMDLSCEENLQNSGNQNTSVVKPADMCIARPDPTLDRDPRLLMNLLTLERSHALHTDYFQDVQVDIQPFMRKVVSSWMLEVGAGANKRFIINKIIRMKYNKICHLHVVKTAD